MELNLTTMMEDSTTPFEETRQRRIHNDGIWTSLSPLEIELKDNFLVDLNPISSDVKNEDSLSRSKEEDEATEHGGSPFLNNEIQGTIGATGSTPESTATDSPVSITLTRNLGEIKIGSHSIDDFRRGFVLPPVDSAHKLHLPNRTLNVRKSPPAHETRSSVLLKYPRRRPTKLHIPSSPSSRSAKLPSSHSPCFNDDAIAAIRRSNSSHHYGRKKAASLSPMLHKKKNTHYSETKKHRRKEALATKSRKDSAADLLQQPPLNYSPSSSPKRRSREALEGTPERKKTRVERRFSEPNVSISNLSNRCPKTPNFRSSRSSSDDTTFSFSPSRVKRLESYINLKSSSPNISKNPSSVYIKSHRLGDREDCNSDKSNENSPAHSISSEATQTQPRRRYGTRHGFTILPHDSPKLRGIKKKPGTRAFECNYCNTIWTQRSNIVAHVRVHTGEKPFECIKCQKSFTQKSNLKRHLRTRHQSRYDDLYDK